MTGRDRAWAVRRFKPEDIDQIRALATVVFDEQPPDRFSAEYWNWEFRDAPFGPSSIWVADDHERVVGHYAANPLIYQVDGKPVRGAIVVDVMSHGDYRNQGMFTALGRVAMSGAGEDGIVFCVGYPVRPEVMPGHLKVGWAHAFDLPVYALPLEFGGALGQVAPSWFPAERLAPLARGVYDRLVRPCFRRTGAARRRPPAPVRDIDHVDERFDAFAEGLGAGYRIGVRRDAAFLRWRYLEHPREAYRLLVAEEADRVVGLAVTRPSELLGIPSLAVVDLAVLPGRPGVVRDLLDEAEREARERKAELVAMMVNPGRSERSALRANGFLRTPSHFTFIIYANRPDVPVDLLHDSANWWITWGDTDVL